jgi:hypothetical protein
MPPAGELKRNSRYPEVAMSITEDLSGAFEEAVELTVEALLVEAQAQGLPLFETMCLIFETGFDIGHQTGHTCATRHSNDDAGDARSSAGYL